MDNKTKNKIKYIVVICFLLIILWVVLLINNSLTFRISSVNPSVNNITNISPFLDINFSKNLSDKILVNSSSNAVKSYTIKNKSLDIELNIPLNSKQKYVIEVSDIYSASRKYLKPQYYSFTPKFVTNNTLPADQSQSLLKQQAQYDQNIQSNSLVKLLPFFGPNFEYRVDYDINYATNPSSIVINITGPTAQSQQDAISWIKSQGYSINNLNINYITAQP